MKKTYWNRVSEFRNLLNLLTSLSTSRWFDLSCSCRKRPLAWCWYLTRFVYWCLLDTIEIGLLYDLELIRILTLCTSRHRFYTVLVLTCTNFYRSYLCLRKRMTKSGMTCLGNVLLGTKQNGWVSESPPRCCVRTHNYLRTVRVISSWLKTEETSTRPSRMATSKSL